jgi:hypothetical protein
MWGFLNALQHRVLEMYLKRDWRLDWMARGVYMHLEVSEFIEAIRGKGDSTPESEAADVVICMMAMVAGANLNWDNIMAEVEQKVTVLETKPQYKNEERGGEVNRMKQVLIDLCPTLEDLVTFIRRMNGTETPVTKIRRLKEACAHVIDEYESETALHLENPRHNMCCCGPSVYNHLKQALELSKEQE